jgi:hypothetical protein
MKRRRRRIAIGIVVAVAIAAAAHVFWRNWLSPQSRAWHTLADAEQYELVSLDPRHLGWGSELGHVAIADGATRERLNRSLLEGVWASDGTMFACFEPRHGIRVTRAGVTTEFVICFCFQCRQIRVVRGDQVVACFLASPSPEPVFDEVLKAAGVPLAPKDMESTAPARGGRPVH